MRKLKNIFRVLTYSTLIYFTFGFTNIKVKYIPIPRVEEKTQPLIIAHRGDQNSGVENTIPSIAGAISAKSNFAEIDVLLTKDNVPIVFHDGYLNRLANIDKAIYDLTYDELKNITLTQGKFQAHIYTLEEIVNFCNGKIPLLIEFKLHGHETASVVDETMRVIKDNAINPKSYYFYSFTYALVKECKEKYPKYTTGYLVNADSVGNLKDDYILNNIDFVAAEQSNVTLELLNTLNNANKPLFAWTVNKESQMTKLFDMGVDGIITDQIEIAEKMCK